MKQPALITIVRLASETCIEAAAERKSAMSMCGDYMSELLGFSFGYTI